jgi:hypothetical protein
MQDVDIKTIKNAESAIERITKINKEFLTNANEYATCSRIRSSLQILGDALAVDCFGHLATAKPRLVRMATGSYFMEYVFTVPFGSQMIEVTRFYLSEDGQILDDPTTDGFICQHNNLLIATPLCARVLLGFLESPLLAPAKAQRCDLDIHVTGPVTVSG